MVEEKNWDQSETNQGRGCRKEKENEDEKK